MSITYPLTIPGTIFPSAADLKQFDGIGEFISPFGGQAEQQQFQDQHWELDLEWPDMTWAQFAILQAFSGALHGKLGTFLWGPPLASGPQGLGYSGGSAPACAGSDLSGSNTLTTQGWIPNTYGLLMPGDFFQLGTSPPRLYQYVGASGLESNFGGGAAIDIFPSIREAPTAGQSLRLLQAQGTFRLAENRRSAPAKKTKTFGFSMKCREAI